MSLGSQLQELFVKAGIEVDPLNAQCPQTIPCLALACESWAEAAKLAREQSLRLVALWADQGGQGAYGLYAVYARSGAGYALLKTTLQNKTVEFPSIVGHYIAAARMERIIHDLYGLLPVGHPDLRPWINHGYWQAGSGPLQQAFNAESLSQTTAGEYPFLELESEGVYQIPVGLVHAGIIEPGHFRFLAVGEQILNMEARLGYVHKGIEKRIAGRCAPDAVRLAGRVSGDATVAHAWAFCAAAESAAQIEIPLRARQLRAVLCERERMANHIGDIGAICNDAAWSFMHMQCQRLREDMARLHERLFGHRLLMDRVVPGGVGFDLVSDDIPVLLAQTHELAEEMARLFLLYEEHTPIRERVVDSGNISQKDSLDLGLVGYVARAAEVGIDARCDAAYSPYDICTVQPVVCPGGDVSSRLWVRFKEIESSARLIERLLMNLDDSPGRCEWRDPEAGACGFAVIESWRGEIATWVRFEVEGKVGRYYVRDPSVVNWLGLELVVRSVPVPDFPLNNKSFNCSYSGHDL